LKLNQSLIRT